MPLPRKIKTIPEIAGLIFAVGVMTGCTQVPELGDRVTPEIKDAAYPLLVPLDESLTTPPNPMVEAAEVEETLIARVQRLKNRAKQLQGPVVDRQTQSRMNQGITQ